MRKIFILVLILFVVPLVSAEIIFNQQPQDVYNLGDTIPFPVTIKSSADVSGVFQMDILCDGHKTDFYKNGVSLASGDEKRFDSSLVLIQSVIGELKGGCRVKAFLGDDFALSNDFSVSDLITISVIFDPIEFAPGENIFIEGDALKPNGNSVDGFIELSFLDGNTSIINQLETINNGFFSINVTLPGDIKAGFYLLKLRAYEEDINNEITNNGFSDQNIRITQVPTSLEIIFDSIEVEPGTNLLVKAILHDQTGEKIESTSFITVKNSKDKIFEQTEITTDEFFEFPIAYNEAPSTWKVVAVSNRITSESSFEIIEKEEIKINIINKTLTITNTGNVLYNKTALVKIEDKSLNIDVNLKVDESQKYVLTAPDGEYTVEIISDGESTITESVTLTGKSIDVKKAPGRVGSLVKYPFAWVFIILILGFITFITFKRGYQKNFIGYITSRIPKKKHAEGGLVQVEKHDTAGSKNIAELSLSIKGDKQNVSVVAVNIKNLREADSKEGNFKETIQKVITAAEKHKAVTYESHGTKFFIVAPTKTRTFKNERTALSIAQKIKEILEHHNKTFKQKIEFGISLNYGTIVAKQDQDSLKFMSMGTLMTAAKKISSIAKNDILLGEKINDRLRSDVRTTRHEKGNIHVYSIKEVKNVEEHRQFVRDFVNRMDKDKKAKEKK